MAALSKAIHLLLIAVAFLATPAAAAPVGKGDPAKTELPVPANALVVVQLHGVGTAREKVAKFLEAAVPDLAPKAKKRFDAFLKDALEDRDLSAVTPDGRVYLAVFGLPNFGTDPPVALLLPTADYKTFREKLLTADERKSFDKGRDGVDQFDSMDRTVYLVDLTKKGYVAVAVRREVAEAFAKKFDSLTGAKMGEPVSAAFLGCDLSVFVNLAEINDRYGDQLRGIRGTLIAFLQQGAPGLDKRQLEQARAVYEALFQAVEDGSGLALGLEFRPDGLTLRAEAAFAKDTPSAKLLAKEQPTPLDRLGSLPKGQAFYAAGRLTPQLSQAAQGLAPDFAVGEGEEKAAAAIEKYADLSAAARGEGWISAGSGPKGSLQVSFPADPAKLVEAQVKVLKNLPADGRYQNVVLKERPELKEGERAHRGFTLDRVTLIPDFEATAGNIPDENVRKAAIESMRKLVGDKTTYWFGTDGKRFVQVAGKDWDAAGKLLDAYLDGKEVGADETFQAVRKQLPAEASQVMIAEVGATVASFGGYVKSVAEAMPGLPGLDVPELKPAPGSAPAYVGAAVVLKPGSAGLTVTAPVGAVKAARKVLAPLFERKDD